ncbi:class I glutamine amidotransferase-like protein [Pavlovales sp. CCMP2436]|nr:class I glutamine amidotransferase-like protein [Pavlovales sp. CCMP2436]
MRGALLVAVALAFSPSRPLSPSRRSLVVMSAKKQVLVPIADGSEEIESVCVIDVLVRAGAEVTVASVMPTGLQVMCSRGVKIVADAMIADVAGKTFDAIILPGGMPGSVHLADCEPLAAMLKSQVGAGRLTGAICAAPVVVLQKHGLLEGKMATSHPGFSDKLLDQGPVLTRVVVDGNLVTSRGPGTALEFALTLVEQLYGAEKAKEVAGPMVMP